MNDSAIKDFLVESPDPDMKIPVEKKHLNRFPILFLLDTSGSTSVGDDDADIHKIQQVMTDILSMLKLPPADSEIAHNQSEIDVAVIAYDDEPKVLVNWTPGDQLSTSIQLQAGGRTATCAAIRMAFSMIAKQLRYYRDIHKVPSSGLAHIFHITDGAPTDFTINSPQWHELQKYIAGIDRSDAKNPEERPFAVFLNFITPNGCRIVNPSISPKDENGKPMTGQEFLSRFTGSQTIYTIQEGSESLGNLLQLVTRVITQITGIFEPDSSVANRAAKDFVQSHDSGINAGENRGTNPDEL